MFGTICIPLTVSLGGKDGFRLPKELLFRLEIVIILALGLAGAACHAIPTIAAAVRARPSPLLLAAMALVWVAVVTATATVPLLALSSYLTFVSIMLLFTATYALAARQQLDAIHAVFWPAAVNSIIAVITAITGWHPLVDHPYDRAFGLLGNPNDLGAYLVVPALAGVTLSTLARDRRWRYALLSCLLVGGLLASQTLSALAAFSVGLGILAGTQMSQKPRVAVAIAVAIAVLATLGAIALFRQRVITMTKAVAMGDLDRFVSGRLISNTAAFYMWLDHPLLGVGPGCFAWQYYDYKIRAEESNPRLLIATARGSNFGEVHNDHLQILCETGLPGYALFIGAFFLLVRVRFSDEAPTDERARFARTFTPVMAAAVFVLMLGQFPLQLVSCVSALQFTSALCLRWGRS